MRPHCAGLDDPVGVRDLTEVGRLDVSFLRRTLWGEPPGEPSTYAQAVAARLRGEAEEILTALRQGRPATFRRHGRCAG